MWRPTRQNHNDLVIREDMDPSQSQGELQDGFPAFGRLLLTAVENISEDEFSCKGETGKEDPTPGTWTKKAWLLLTVPLAVIIACSLMWLYSVGGTSNPWHKAQRKWSLSFFGIEIGYWMDPMYDTALLNIYKILCSVELS